MNLRIVAMGLCCALFFVRVTGQIMVGLYAPDWLPPMTAWYAGLLPYPLLLPAQLVVLMIMASVTAEQARHGSQFPQSHPTLARWLSRFAWLYAFAMAVRYLVATWITDMQHWYDGGLIPVTFHWVLAGFIWLAVRDSEWGRSGTGPGRLRPSGCEAARNRHPTTGPHMFDQGPQLRRD